MDVMRLDLTEHGRGRVFVMSVWVIFLQILRYGGARVIGSVACVKKWRIKNEISGFVISCV